MWHIRPYSGILKTRHLFFVVKQLFLLLWKDHAELAGIVYYPLSEKGRGERKACSSSDAKGGTEENRQEAGRRVRRLALRPGDKG